MRGQAHAVSARERRFVALVLTLLIVPGVIGFEAWPLTAWRLFSLSRDDDQTRWEIEAVVDGDVRPLDLDDLPLGYRNAEWLLAQLPGASTDEREAMCDGLLEGALEVRPDATALRLVRDRQRLVDHGGEWVVEHDREVLHTCDVEDAS